MLVAVLGATGRTGQLVVTELLARGHAVRALVRDATKVDPRHHAIAVIVGDSRDASALAPLLDDAEAVVSALGPTGKEPSLHSDTARALVATMEQAGVSRFVGVSGAGIDVPDDAKALPARLISKALQTFGGDVVHDKRHEYDVLAASDIDWTLVRPPRLADGASIGRIEHDAHRSTRSTKMTRGDLAAFLVDCLEQDLYLRQAPFAASAR